MSEELDSDQFELEESEVGESEVYDSEGWDSETSALGKLTTRLRINKATEHEVQARCSLFFYKIDTKACSQCRKVWLLTTRIVCRCIQPRGRHNNIAIYELQIRIALSFPRLPTIFPAGDQSTA
jgi:hypothetical protein